MNRQVRLLVWQVEGDSSKTILGMVRGESFALVLVETPDGGYDHLSQGFDTPEGAEAYLLLKTEHVGDELLLPPTEHEVPAPRAVHVDSNDFKLWVVEHVVNVVDMEVLRRKLASATFTFGKPQPAFSR